MDLSGLLDDLAAETLSLDRVVAGLSPDGWLRDTPSPGWTVGHQIAHLAWTDGVVRLAATDPAGFGTVLAGAAADPDGFVDRAAARLRTEAGFRNGAGRRTPGTGARTQRNDGAGRRTPGTGARTQRNDGDDPAGGGRLLARWRAGARALRETLAALPPGTVIPWFGTAMAATSMATARIMETWAHGVDVRDALGLPVEPTTRLRHVAYLGFRTLGHSFAVNGLPEPAGPVHLRLSGPDGAVWTYGPDGATDTVTGPALDFCLLVTRRRHRDDLALTATGEVARRWLGVAQAYAGPPGAGRPAGSPAGGGAR